MCNIVFVYNNYSLVFTISSYITIVSSDVHVLIIIDRYAQWFKEIEINIYQLNTL